LVEHGRHNKGPYLCKKLIGLFDEPVNMGKLLGPLFMAHTARITTAVELIIVDIGTMNETSGARRKAVDGGSFL
jgi:hypothetical protein